MSDLDVQGLDSVFSLQRNLETTRWSTEKTYIKEDKLLNADMYLAVGLFPLLDKIIKKIYIYLIINIIFTMMILEVC